MSLSIEVEEECAEDTAVHVYLHGWMFDVFSALHVFVNASDCTHSGQAV